MYAPDRHFAAKQQVEIVIGSDRILRLNVDGVCAMRVLLEKLNGDRCRIDVRNDLPEYASAFAGGRDGNELRTKLDQMEDRFSELIEALSQIDSWSRAYPLTVFPEPDLVKARVLLESGGITLDAVSASMARHVIEGVGKLARDALKEEPS